MSIEKREGLDAVVTCNSVDKSDILYAGSRDACIAFTRIYTNIFSNGMTVWKLGDDGELTDPVTMPMLWE